MTPPPHAAALPPVRLAGLGQALAPHRLAQDEALGWARERFAGRYPGFERMVPVFANTGIGERQIAMPVEWYLAPQDWATRTAAYRTVASDLYVAAARDALDAAQCRADAIDIVVTVSTSGIATPSLDALVHGRLGLRADVVRVPVFGLGCAGGIAGLALGARLAATRPGARVLVVAVELCSLSFRDDLVNKANIVATALFGDGAAAAVLAADQAPGLRISAAAEHLWRDTIDVMGWDVAPQGLGVVFAQSIPALVAREMARTTDALCARLGLERADIGRLACHPGGAKVLAAIETALALDAGTLAAERAVLADHGNMSAPTVLVVLKRLLAAGDLPLAAPTLAMALGPGFTLNAVRLDHAA